MSRGVRIRGRQRESEGPAPTVLRTPRVAGSAAAQAVILWPVTGAQMFKACLWGDDCVATDAMLRGWILSCPFWDLMFEVWDLGCVHVYVLTCVCIGGHASVQKGGKRQWDPAQFPAHSASSVSLLEKKKEWTDPEWMKRWWEMKAA